MAVRLSKPPNWPPEQPQGFNDPIILPEKKTVIPSVWLIPVLYGCGVDFSGSDNLHEVIAVSIIKMKITIFFILNEELNCFRIYDTLCLCFLVFLFYNTVFLAVHRKIIPFVVLQV